MSEQMMRDLRYPGWQKTYQEALIEIDSDKLKERVAAAESAIFNRLQAMLPNRDTVRERQAIEDALSSLRYLKRETLEFSTCGEP
jgi:hypothetical protein